MVLFAVSYALLPMAFPGLQSRKLEGHLADFIPSIAKTIVSRSSRSLSLHTVQ